MSSYPCTINITVVPAMQRHPMPVVTGISPHQGVPGTQITIRGENLGLDASDLVELKICGTDCLMSAKWKSPSKIVTRIGQAKRGVGDILVRTRSGGTGISNVQFRVFIEEIGPLQESCVWVDESKTVPGRNVIRTHTDQTENEDVLGLKVDSLRQFDSAYWSQILPGRSGNFHNENFSSAWYLLENHQKKSLSELQQGLKNLHSSIIKEEETSKNLHKANLNALINCVNALVGLHTKIITTTKTSKWPMTLTLAKEIDNSRQMVDKLFRGVLTRKDHADSIRNAISILTRFRFIFFLPESIDDNIAKEDYSAIINDYTRAKSLFSDTEILLFKEVMIVLDEKIELVKHSIRQKLIEIPDSFETQSKLIKYLMILDSTSDPAWDCIIAYHSWLEELLWRTQHKYFKLAMDDERREAQNQSAETQTTLNVVFGTLGDSQSQPDTGGYRQAFVTELLEILTEKLDAFWKLLQSYSENDDKLEEKRENIEQMLKNTINVSSWLLLNSLVPSSLPESVSSQYSEQFVNWPKLNSSIQMNNLFFSLRAIRVSIKVLLDHQFTRAHVQPLVELSMTIRLKALGLVVEQSSEAITKLASRENWKLDIISNDPKTSLPDLYITEVKKINFILLWINDVLPNIQQILSSDHFPGEINLFMRERICQMIVELFVVLLLSYKDCCDKLIHLKVFGETKRPTRLLGEEMFSSLNENANRIKFIQEINGKKLLIVYCNVLYIVRNCLPLIGRRLAENGVKFCDVILTRSNQTLVQYKHLMLKYYISTKMFTINSLLETANYEDIPDEEDVTDFIKELVMCCVFIQAELYFIFSPLIKQVLSIIVNKMMDGVFKLILKSNLSTPENSTQVIIDLTALEDAFQLYLMPTKMSKINSIRCRLMNNMDTGSFQASIETFRKNLGMAIECLQMSYDENDDLSQQGSSKLDNSSADNDSIAVYDDTTSETV